MRPATAPAGLATARRAGVGTYVPAGAAGPPQESS